MENMKDFEQLYNERIPNKNHMVYFLFKDEKIIYIGKTTNGFTRVYDHTDKDFDSFSYFMCPASKVNEYEAEYIMKYKPKHNKVIPPNSYFMSFNKLKREYKITYHKISSLAIEHGLEVFEFKGINYVKAKKIIKLIEDTDLC